MRYVHKALGINNASAGVLITLLFIMKRHRSLDSHDNCELYKYIYIYTLISAI